MMDIRFYFLFFMFLSSCNDDKLGSLDNKVIEEYDVNLTLYGLAISQALIKPVLPGLPEKKVYNKKDSVYLLSKEKMASIKNYSISVSDSIWNRFSEIYGDIEEQAFFEGILRKTISKEFFDFNELKNQIPYLIVPKYSDLTFNERLELGYIGNIKFTNITYNQDSTEGLFYMEQKLTRGAIGWRVNCKKDLEQWSVNSGMLYIP